MVLVLLTGPHFFPVWLMPPSMHWRNFAELKHHDYVVKHAVVHRLDPSGLETKRISKFCLPLKATALADCSFYSFHFLMTVKSWLWVSGWLWASSFVMLFMEVKGMWWRGKKKMSTAMMKLVESCTMGWMTSRPRALISCWQVAQICSEPNEATSAT